MMDSAGSKKSVTCRSNFIDELSSDASSVIITKYMPPVRISHHVKRKKNKKKKKQKKNKKNKQKTNKRIN